MNAPAPVTFRLLTACTGLLLAACTAADPAGDDSGDSGDAGDSGAPAPTWEAPTYEGDCPDFADGSNDGFLSHGTERSMKIALPDDPTGAPVLFAWHWLGGTGSQIMDWVGYDALADEGVIVVAPDSDGYAYEWRWDKPADDNADVQLFDDTIACLHEQFQVDLGRIHTTGMSAGGLWSTYLTTYRSDRLASAAPLSGGVNSQYYVSPEEPIPVMVVWGGPSDTYNGFSFEDASLDFSADLREDGHFVVECVHNDGHSIPNDVATWTWDFFAAHPKGVDPLPWVEGLPTSQPDICSIPG
jgi:dienelactone hydrolase